MKQLIYFLTLMTSFSAISQIEIPVFLSGTWKSEDGKSYEHWDVAGSEKLKGMVYSFNGERISVDEYIEIQKVKKKVIYKATVLGHNDGKEIPFILKTTGDTLSFENPKHDFPKKIVYSRISENSILVDVKGDGNSFSYRMNRIEEIKTDSTVNNPNYDAQLANDLGGDDYGMKSYYLVILKTGVNKTTDKEFISNCFNGHMENIHKLVDKEKLIVAGPLGKNDLTYRGIFIMVAKDREELELMLQDDPAIKENLLEPIVLDWYGSAALKKYLPYSDMIWKKKP